MPDLVYFDACVFIELLQQSIQKRFEACEDLREKAAKGDLIIVTSSVTIVEVNKLPDSPQLPEEQSKKILEFFENPYIAVRVPDRRTAEYAHELTRTHGLMPNDAIHVATAVLAKVSVLYTYDSVKNRRKGLLRHNLKIGTPPLRIEVPPDPLDGTLFGEKHLAKIASKDVANEKTKPTLTFKGDVAASAPDSTNSHDTGGGLIQGADDSASGKNEKGDAEEVA